MQIVLDSNVLAPLRNPFWARPGKSSFAVRRSHTSYFFGVIISELRCVLCYDRVRKMHGLDNAGIERYVLDVDP